MTETQEMAARNIEALLELLALMDEWLGNSDVETVVDIIDHTIEWRDRLASALGKGPR